MPHAYGPIALLKLNAGARKSAPCLRPHCSSGTQRRSAQKCPMSTPIVCVGAEHGRVQTCPFRQIQGIVIPLSSRINIRMVPKHEVSYLGLLSIFRTYFSASCFRCFGTFLTKENNSSVELELASELERCCVHIEHIEPFIVLKVEQVFRY